MNRLLACAILGVTAMCLSACGDGKKKAGQTIDKAEGEVLKRSVTDDMLPYDTVRSQPPLATPTDAKTPGRAGSPASDKGDASSDDPRSEEPAPADGPSQPLPSPE